MERLIDAWHRIRADGWECRIVGPDREGYKQKLRRKIDALGLRDHVHLLDMKLGDEKRVEYQNADLFVLPTDTESFGVAVAEALAAGLPVITTKGAPWKALKDHAMGDWVDINTDAVARAMQEAMMLSDEARAQMGDRGRRYVENRYAWPKIAEEMSAVYRWICGVGPRPACVQG